MFPDMISPAANTFAKGVPSVLLGYPAAPDGVALRPQVFTFVVKALGPAVNGDPERDRIKAGDNAAVETGGPGINGNGVETLLVTCACRSFLIETAKDLAVIDGRAPYDKIPCCLSP
jgi:hypothetical protein